MIKVPSDSSINDARKRLFFLGFFVLLSVVAIYGSFLMVTKVFLKDYVYYKESTAPNLLFEINSKLSYGNLLKARSQLYCERKFRKLDECYVVVIVTSNPEKVMADRTSLEPLVIDFMKQYALKANKIRQPRFTVTRVKFTYNDQYLFEINLK